MEEGKPASEIIPPQITFKPIKITDAQLLVHLKRKVEPESGGKNKEGGTIDDMVDKLIRLEGQYPKDYPQSFIEYYGGKPVGYMLLNYSQDNIGIADMGIIPTHRNNPQLVIEMVKKLLIFKRGTQSFTYDAWAKEDTTYRILSMNGIKSRLQTELGYEIVDLNQSRNLGSEKKPNMYHHIVLRPIIPE